MTAALLVDPAGLAVRFGEALAAAGLRVGAERGARLARALVLLPPVDRARLYWTARAVLVAGPEQLEVFDRVFALVFGGTADLADVRRNPDAPPAGLGAQPAPGAPGAGRTVTAAGGGAPVLPGSARTDPRAGSTRDALLAAASPDELLHRTDFADLAPEELAALAGLIRRLAPAPPPRRTRRSRPHRTGSLDLRRTLRRAHRTGGDPLKLARRHRPLRPRRLVLLCDVSASMEPYARAYLTLLQGAVAGTRAEAFVFATRLTRLTRALAGGDVDAALARAARTAPDWSSGTRLADSLRAFLDEHGRRGLARGAVVVILSDGWERDAPERVGEQMARLRRLAHRVVWVNPRSAAPGFAPLVGGMAAALPHVDALVSGHSLAALDAVVAAVAGTDDDRKEPGWSSTTASR